MVSLATYAGLDYHQDSVQVCVLDDPGKVLLNRSVDKGVVGVARFGRAHRK